MLYFVSALISGIDEKVTDQETYLREIGFLFGHHIQHHKNDVFQNSVAQCLKSKIRPHLMVVLGFVLFSLGNFEMSENHPGSL